eukprot:9101439-Pyramimonas_sp.AAC.1
MIVNRQWEGALVVILLFLCLAPLKGGDIQYYFILRVRRGSGWGQGPPPTTARVLFTPQADLSC